MSEKTFPTGFYVDRPNENAPDFVKAKISIKSKDFFEFVKKHTNNRGYINLDVLESREGKLYATLNEWKKPEGLEGEEAEKVRNLRENAQKAQETAQNTPDPRIDPKDDSLDVSDIPF